MDEFIDNIIIYGFLFGFFIAVVSYVTFFIKERKGKVTLKTIFLPFIGTASIFSMVGIGIIIQKLYNNISVDAIEFFLGLGLNIPMFIVFIFYLVVHINETKEAKIYEQEEKYSKW